MRIQNLLHAVEHALREIGCYHFVPKLGERQGKGAGSAAHVEHGFAGFDAHKLDEPFRVGAGLRIGGEILRARVPFGGIVVVVACRLNALPFGIPIGGGQEGNGLV